MLVYHRDASVYTSEVEVIKTATEAGYTDIYKTSLLGVGDLEKRMGKKKFADIVGKFVVKPKGAPPARVGNRSPKALHRRDE